MGDSHFDMDQDYLRGEHAEPADEEPIPATSRSRARSAVGASERSAPRPERARQRARPEYRAEYVHAASREVGFDQRQRVIAVLAALLTPRPLAANDDDEESPGLLPPTG